MRWTEPIRRTILLFLIAGWLAPIGRAAEAADPTGTTTPDKTTGPSTSWKGFGKATDKLPEPTDLLRQFATAIGLVVVLGVAAYSVSRRLGPRWSSSRGRHLRIIESIGLGPHRQIHLLEVDGRRLVIGSTGQSIGMIADVSNAAETKGSDSK